MLLISATGATASGPRWAEPGDARLRSDIEVLASRGLIKGPLTTWPLPAAQLARTLDVSNGDSLPRHVRRSLERVKRFVERESWYGGEAGFIWTNEPRLVRDFDYAAREEVDAEFAIDRWWTSTSLRLRVGYLGNFDSGQVVADGSYLVQRLGGWLAYAGLVDQWWGPGWTGSVILSDNARPFPKIGLMRRDPKPFGTRWLSWIGGWQVNALLGVLDESGRTVENPLFVGLRVMVAPLAWLELGFTRTLMICGEGRPCGFDTWWDALFPFHGVENTQSPDDPSNQLAGFDLRLATRWGRYGGSLYGQYYGEDEQRDWLRSIVVLAGLSIDGPVGDRGALWRLTGEYTDTAADGLEMRATVFNVVYEHDIYRTGYRYRGRAIGHTIDGDGRILSLGLTVDDSAERSYRLQYHWADINRDGACAVSGSSACPHSVSASAEQANILEGLVVVRTTVGHLELRARYEDDRPNTPDRKESTTAVEVGWTRRF